MRQSGFILLMTLIFLPIAGSVLAPGDEGYNHMMNWYPFGWGWGMAVLPLFWIITVGAIVFFLAKGFSGRNIPPPGDKSGSGALEILKERYAKGEIDKEQFEAMKKDIGA